MMDLPRDEVRRQLRDLDAQHRAAMPRWRDSLTRLLVADRATPSEAKSALLLGGFDRRRFLRMTGATIGAAGLVTACGDDSDDADDAGGGTTPAAGGGGDTDATIARTAASLELFAVDVYTTAIDSADALQIEATVASAATLFRDQHREHADAFNGAAEQLGGERVETANPTAAEAFADRIAGLSDQAGVVQFAYELEVIASQTYQGVGAGMLSTAQLRQTAMSIGGVEARHAAVLAMFIDGQEPVPQAFQPTEEAVDASFFV
ncbi:MAG: ferritin-like domain-containing protein [Acidimicrobiales bacterium]